MFIKNIIDTVIKSVRFKRNNVFYLRCLKISGSIIALLIAGALSAEVRTGGTGRTISFGEIDAFGSIVVNGVHHDETAANIIINGVPQQTKAQLKLGMIAEIDGDVNYGQGTGVAHVVVVNRRLFGQIESINGNAAELRLLNQRVSLSAATRIDGFSQFADLSESDWVAIHGLDDPARQTIFATLVERILPATKTMSEIRGNVSKFKNGSFRIGSLTVLFNAATGGNANQLQDGKFVAVSGKYSSSSDATLMASNIVVTREVEVQEQQEAKLQGFVSDYRGLASFTVSGVAIDASHAIFDNGTVADLKSGARVTVGGNVQNGVLIANEIEFPVATNPRQATEAEIEGIITTLNSATDFVVKGRRVDASSAVLVGQLRPFVVGLKVHVVGVLNTDGTVTASKIEIE